MTPRTAIRRQQLFRGVHDEHTTYASCVALIAVPEVEWRSARDVEELRKLTVLDPGAPTRRRLEIVRHASRSIVPGDLRLGARPRASA